MKVFFCLVILVGATNASFGSFFGRGSSSTQRPPQLFKHLHRHEVKVIHDSHGGGGGGISQFQFYGGRGSGVGGGGGAAGYYSGGHGSHGGYGSAQTVQILHEGPPHGRFGGNRFSGTEIAGFVEDGHLHGYGNGHGSQNGGGYNGGGLSTNQIVGYVEDGHAHENHLGRTQAVNNNGLSQSQIVGFVEDAHIHAERGHIHAGDHGHFAGHQNNEQVLQIVHDNNNNNYNNNNNDYVGGAHQGHTENVQVIKFIDEQNHGQPPQAPSHGWSS